jgi:Domain of unknown function (DUF222)
MSYPVRRVAGVNGDEVAGRLETLPVGVELATLVESLDPAEQAGNVLAALLSAEHRLTCHYRGRSLRTMAALAKTAEPRFAFLTASAIAGAIGCSERKATPQLELAKDLDGRLPEVLDAMVDGRIDEWKATLFADKTRPVRDPATVKKIVDKVLPKAPELASEELSRRLAYRVRKYDPEAAAKRSKAARQHRRMDYSEVGDGTAIITGIGLPVEGAAAAVERVDAFARAARAGGDSRTLQQLRADAMVGLLAGTWHGPEPIHRVGVIELTIPLTTLMRLRDLPGELAGWGPLCGDIARQTAEQMLKRKSQPPQVRYTVYDNNGLVVADGTTRRRPPTAMGATVRARYDRCIFPRCSQPASRSDLDHHQRWIDGGATSVDNLFPLCRRHHRAKDEGGWRYDVLSPGVFRWVSPLGQVIVEDRRRFADRTGEDTDAA